MTDEITLIEFEFAYKGLEVKDYVTIQEGRDTIRETENGLAFDVYPDGNTAETLEVISSELRSQKTTTRRVKLR